MSRPMVKGGLLAILMFAGLVLAQQPAYQSAEKPAKPEPGSMEDMLAQAMKNNPDIRVAEAKLREADAELNRVRLQVIQKLVTHHHTVDALKKTVAEAEMRYKSYVELFKKGAVPREEVSSAELTLMRYKAELAKAEAELPYLLGKAPPGADKLQGGILRWDTPMLGEDVQARFAPAQALVVLRHNISGSMADKIHRALDTPVKVDYKEKSSLEILEDLLQKAEGVPYRITVKIDAPNSKHTLQFKEPLSLGAALQAFQDLAGGNHVRFVVRDYGILVTHDQIIPPGAILLHDLWKSKPAAEPKKEK